MSAREYAAAYCPSGQPTALNPVEIELSNWMLDWRQTESHPFLRKWGAVIESITGVPLADKSKMQQYALAYAAAEMAVK